MKRLLFLKKCLNNKINILDILNIKKHFLFFMNKNKRFLCFYYKFLKCIIKKIFIYRTNEIRINSFICYFGYESSSFYKKNANDLFSNMFLLISNKNIFFDRKLNKLFLLFKIKRNKKNIKKSILEVIRILNFKYILHEKHKYKKIKQNFSNEYYRNFFYIKEMIRNGEIMQVQLGKKNFIRRNIKNIKKLYKNIINFNTKEISFVFSYNNKILITNTPETFVRGNNSTNMFPIAGTIKRGINLLEDKILERKLIKDKKELSEHNMLLDMTRNDLLSINPSKINFDVIYKKKISKYFFLQHIVSRISLNNKYSLIMTILKTFPSGTLTGAPKIKAMKIIKKIENYNREFYGGLLGFKIKNNFDIFLIIRSLFLSNKRIYLHAASGIVKDSKIINEKEEIKNKMKNLIKSIENYDLHS
ncbi:chorismate-binding protein [Candidatus Vidania fulgoroideorum]